jgi:hypothetical protein
MGRGVTQHVRSLIIATALVVASPVASEIKPLEVRGFTFDLAVDVAGTPESAYDAFTAEALAWWDHHFSPDPYRLLFEARPGGRFVELFDGSGDGAAHATVIYADRGKRLRFVGPLGLSGRAVEIVHTLELSPIEGGTRVKLAVAATGAYEDGIPAILEKVWHHFLEDEFRPYMALRGDGEHPYVAALRRYRAARDRQDVEGARAVLAADARIWFETREDPGAPVDPAAGGPWADWDRFFHSESAFADPRIREREMRVTVSEVNDWYRLVNRPESTYYMTYGFDESGRIASILVHPIPKLPKVEDWLDSFEAWARVRHPGLIERLKPGGRIDPALDKAKHWTEALLEWRKEAGLPNPIGPAPK